MLINGCLRKPGVKGTRTGVSQRHGASVDGIQIVPILTLSCTHALVDFNPSAIAALLPVYFLALHLSIAQTALLSAISQVSNSLVQLPFGFLADRRSLRLLIPVGYTVAIGGLILLTLATSFGQLAVAIAVSGIGVAIYHPEGARTANTISGEKKVTGMSIFSVGGNLGFGIGPVIAAALHRTGDQFAFFALLVPVAIISVSFFRNARLRSGTEKKAQRIIGHPCLHQAYGALTLLLLITTLRSALQVGLLTFVPLLEVTVRRHTATYVSVLLTGFLLSGAAGTVIGGFAADRYGRTATLLLSFVLTIPCLLVYRYDTGTFAVIALILAGGSLLSTFAVTVVMGQELLPRRAGVAASLTIGVTSGLGGVLVAGAGEWAQRIGLPNIITIFVIMAFCAGILAFWLTLLRQPTLSLTMEP